MSNLGDRLHHVSYHLRVGGSVDQDAVLTINDQLVHCADGSRDRDAAKLLRFSDHQGRTFPARRHDQHVGPAERLDQIPACKDGRAHLDAKLFQPVGPGEAGISQDLAADRPGVERHTRRAQLEIVAASRSMPFCWSRRPM